MFYVSLDKHYILRIVLPPPFGVEVMDGGWT